MDKSAKPPFAPPPDQEAELERIRLRDEAEHQETERRDDLAEAEFLKGTIEPTIKK